MTSDFINNLPGELVKHVTGMLGSVGEKWLSDLPPAIERLEQQWSVVVGDPFAAIEFNYVAAAVRNDGTDAVVKIAPPFDSQEGFSEAAFLRHKRGLGCVRLLAEDRELRAMLIERALPGENFTDHFRDREPESVLPAIKVLGALQGPPPGDLSDVIYLDDWFDGMKRYPSTGFPHRYAEKALELYDHLSKGREHTYLHGDFHPGNIVTATREPFLAIDPKGILGHLGYEIAVFLNNFHWWQETLDDVHERLDSAVDQFSQASPLSELELRQWAFAQMVLGAWWTYDEMPDLYDNEVNKADIWGIL